MTATPPPLAAPSAPGAGRIVAGISIALGWGTVHWVLFYVVAVSGILADIALLFIRSFMFPGWKAPASATEFAWALPLQAGFILAGAAGVPLGDSLIWRKRAKLLRWMFWILFLAGVAVELLAFIKWLSSAFAA